MNIEALASPTALRQPTYEPGRPIEDVARELGLDPASITKLASNENPWGASPAALVAAAEALRQPALYPDGGATRLREAIARARGVTPSEVVVGNGSNEILELLGHALLRPGDEVVAGWPAFVVFRLVALLFGAKPVEVPLRDWAHDLNAMRGAVTERTRLVFLASPNNPTGRPNRPDEIVAFARSLPEHVVLAFDEAYAEYASDPADLLPLVREGRPVVCLRTFSKIHGLAALRLGYAVCAPPLASLLQRVRQPFHVNAVAQAAGIAALDDTAWVARGVEDNRRGLEQMLAGVSALGLQTVPSEANFLLVRTGAGRAVFGALQREGVIVRPMDGYDLPEWIRVSVGTPSQNERFLEALARVVRARG